MRREERAVGPNIRNRSRCTPAKEVVAVRRRRGGKGEDVVIGG